MEGKKCIYGGRRRWALSWRIERMLAGSPAGRCVEESNFRRQSISAAASCSSLVTPPSTSVRAYVTPCLNRWPPLQSRPSGSMFWCLAPDVRDCLLWRPHLVRQGSLWRDKAG